jgi:hypothetical protein
MDIALAVADDSKVELAEFSEREARGFLKTLLPRMPGDNDSAIALLRELTRHLPGSSLHQEKQYDYPEVPLASAEDTEGGD